MAAFVAEAIGIPIKPAGRAAAVDTNVEAAPPPPSLMLACALGRKSLV
jgi:hypothetical protein